MPYVTVDCVVTTEHLQEYVKDCPDLDKHVRSYGLFSSRVTGDVWYSETTTFGDYDQCSRVKRWKDTCSTCKGRLTVFSRRVLEPDRRVGWIYTFDTDENCERCGGHGYQCDRCLGTGGVYVSKERVDYKL